jgi:simple sugar transport system permease protein
VDLALSFLAQIARMVVPYAMVAVGGCLCERSGVVNIGLEGILLNSAFGAAMGTIPTGSIAFGILCGVICGAATALFHALVTVWARADQIVSGLAINIASLAGTRALLKVIYGSASNSPRLLGSAPTPLPGFHVLGPLGETIGLPLFLAAVAIWFLADRLLLRSGVGLIVRAAGERPAACDASGFDVAKVRTIAIVTGGAIAGLGGAWLVFQQNSFTDGMSGGRGYIALAAMIAGKWRPAGAVAACFVFATAEALQIRLAGNGVATQFLNMLPYLIALAVLAGWVGRAVPPAALGRPYRRGTEEV